MYMFKRLSEVRKMKAKWLIEDIELLPHAPLGSLALVECLTANGMREYFDVA